MINLDIIAGARPNFMKIAPIIEELEKVRDRIRYRLIHTGQHYDKKMSGGFFEQLGIPEPHINLEVGSGTQAQQTAKIMERYESVLLKKSADYVLVVGDVTSTLACAITAKKLGVKVIHVEGGIRSHDISMPEEINRMVTDSITDIFYTTSKVANENLRQLGHSEEKIRYVGNTMIDTLLKNMPHFKQPRIWMELGLKDKNYFVLTLHRPANVDEEENLKILLEEIIKSSKGKPVIFPVHPRTEKIVNALSLSSTNLYAVEPLGYLEFNYLVKHALGVITDSGGITEETTVMNIPCMTLRDNTERPETIDIGTNELVGTNPINIYPYMNKLHDGQWKKGHVPDLWDGRTASRIILDLLNETND